MLRTCLCRLYMQPQSSIQCCRSKIRAKDYKFPEIRMKDVEMTFAKGSGPGGMNVNSSVNKVVLRHLPTGLIVTAHDDRSVERNKTIAYERLKYKLDDYLNGENSFTAQNRRYELEKKRAQDELNKERRERKIALKKIREEAMKAIKDD